MSRRRLLLTALVLLTLSMLMAGCSPNMDTITTEDLAEGNFWQKYIVYPMSYSLDWIAGHMWGQYGLSILIVTIVIRFAVLPLTLKQYKSQKEMQKLQPEMKKLKDKYKNDPKKQQEETMKLFQMHGVNPLAGCFPILVQMPILLALYNAIIWNPDIRTHEFLGFWVLGEPDKYFILPVLAALTTFIQQKVMTAKNPMPNQMAGLLYIFPVLIFVMAMSFPSALPLYWVYGNIFTIIQTYFIYGKAEPKEGLSK